MDMCFSLLLPDPAANTIKLLSLTISYKKCNVFYGFAQRLDADTLKKGDKSVPPFLIENCFLF